MFETSVAVQTTANAFGGRAPMATTTLRASRPYQSVRASPPSRSKDAAQSFSGTGSQRIVPQLRPTIQREPNSRHEETLSVGLQIVRGHVDSIARAINVSNAQPNTQGVADVNPIFTWCAWRSASAARPYR